EQESAVSARLARDAADRARHEAGESEKKARAEAETAREVASFLAGIFEDADPMAAGGRSFGVQKRSAANLTAREVLDRAAKKLSTALKDRPQVRAVLLDKLGNAYLGLGFVEQAEPLLTEALQLRRQTPGPEHPDLAASLHSVGYLHFLRVRGDESLLLQEALAMRQKLLGE